jgi:hypothetical protein
MVSYFDRLCKLEKRGMKLKKNLLLWNYWANFNQTLLKWSLGGPLSKLCPSAPSFIHPRIISAKFGWDWFSSFRGEFFFVISSPLFSNLQIRKKGGWNKKKIFSSETTEPISTKLCWNDP